MMKDQLIVNKFNKQHNINIDVNTRVLDITSEVGEICKLAFTYKLENTIILNKWEEEIGVVLYSILSLTNSLGINSEVALKKVLLKYELRYITKKYIFLKSINLIFKIFRKI